MTENNNLPVKSEKKSNRIIFDRLQGPNGPWTTESDEEEWKDHLSGYACHMIRNGMGAWCGYVQIKKGHPLFKVHYNDTYEGIYKKYDIDVHGGLTFSDEIEDKEGWWFGFDCAHYQDFTPQMAFMERQFGPQEGMYRDAKYVRNQCTNLAKQLLIIKKEEK